MLRKTVIALIALVATSFSVARLAAFGQDVAADAPTPNQSDADALLDLIRETGAKTARFPDAWVVKTGFIRNWTGDSPVHYKTYNLYYDMTYDYFKPFYCWLEGVGAATIPQMRRCVDEFETMTAREKALTLAAIHLFCVNNKPEYLLNFDQVDAENYEQALANLHNGFIDRFKPVLVCEREDLDELSNEELNAWLDLIDSCREDTSVVFFHIPYDVAEAGRLFYADLRLLFLRAFNLVCDEPSETRADLIADAVKTATSSDPTLLYYWLLQMTANPDALPERESFSDIDQEFLDFFLPEQSEKYGKDGRLTLKYKPITPEEARREITIMNQYLRAQYNVNRSAVVRRSGSASSGVLSDRNRTLGEFAKALSIPH